MRINTTFYYLFVTVICLALTGCSTARLQAPPPEVLNANINEYRLNTGDKIKVTVFGEADLSGTYAVDGIGRVALPLIGDVIVRDKTLDEAERVIIESYSRDYLRDPSITVQIDQYRPFYILGEVKQPGSYPYVDRMTVLNAVALGGGFTYRANKRHVEVKRVLKKTTGSTTVVFNGVLDTPILPGDIIEIDERLF